MNLSPADLPDTEATLSVERWSATSGSERPSRANLTLIGGGHRWRANAGGNGAVDALLRAVDNALAPLLGGRVTLEALENEHIRRVIGQTKTMEEAAQVLGIDPATLYRKRKKLGS